MTMYLAQTQRWTMERVIRVMAGTLVLGGSALGFFVAPAWLLLPALVAVNLLVFSVTGFCPAAVVMHRLGVPER
jgi:hypothetical protein